MFPLSRSDTKTEIGSAWTLMLLRCSLFEDKRHSSFK